MFYAFSQEEMDAFKKIQFPWMESRFVSPVCITFRENMYGYEYRVVKSDCFWGCSAYLFTVNESDDEEYKEEFKEYYGVGSTIHEAFLEFEHEIFAMACFAKSDLSKISKEYIMDSKNRTSLHTQAAISSLLAQKNKSEK